MSINRTNLYPKLFLCLGLVCGMLGVVNSDTASSQTTPSPTDDLEVTAYTGTYFKRQLNWYQQSAEIIDDNQRCYVRRGERFVVSSYRRPVNESPVREDDRNSRYFGNIEYPDDYWEVTFQNLPSRCNSQQNQGGQTWFVYRRHVNIR
ncbi:hypothetical protein A6770_06720 [Nostoc minutum NIES-26]|uniref:Uncharacterized protein n=1 Tax=Nostoc minutum NIES-26 TaxID=1844469 RepID=A0A367Q573_9NOSO|nr:hypothetical protein A6770_06720 [Nostoc minutum NIES-26]